MTYKKRAGSKIIRFCVRAAAVITFSSIIFVAAFILINGIPNIRADMFSWKYTTENHSMLPAIINTISVAGLSLLIAAPIGIFSAIYLVEYAKRGSRAVKAVRLTSETLAGLPSIVYGMFGYLMFSITLGFSFSLLAGALTLAIMILPLIMRTSEEAMRAVPDGYREGSFGLGAGKLRTVFKIVLPSASNGIMAGIMLAFGRVVGETAAIILPAGTAPEVPTTVMGSGRTLAVHVYALLNEGLYTDDAYAAAAVLLIIVLSINVIAGAASRRAAARGAK